MLRWADHGAQARTSKGIHQVDMGTIVPYPAKFKVTAANAYVRDEADLTKFIMDGGKKKVLAVGTELNILGEKTQGSTVYLRIDGGGYTAKANMTASAAPATPPAGAATPKKGATVWAIGRPSFVDFEDGHEYSTTDVPATMISTSPAEIKKLAKTNTDAAKVHIK